MMNKLYFKTFFGTMIILMFYNVSFAGWQFDWTLRSDRDGQLVGAYTNTPFPIDENSTSYTIKNDENPDGKVFNLGTKLFIDGKGGVNSGNCRSFNAPCATIKYAITQTSIGNYTIIVRGAHDSWNGIYYESGIRPNAGTDDTHRFMIVGYKQERPIIDGQSNATNDVFYTTNSTNAYVTLQRLKIQNNTRNGIRLGTLGSKLDGYFSVIDVWLYNLIDITSSTGDGHIYFMNVDNGWIFHVTAEHGYGHCIKVGDDGDNNIVEWSIVRECGYWDGIPVTAYYNHHAAGLDFPNSAGAHADNLKVRYNVSYDTLYYGLQLRDAPNFSVHHNEIYRTERCWDIMTNKESDCNQKGYGNVQVLILGYIYGESDGDFYSNILRNPTTTSGPSDVQRAHISIYAVNTNSPKINIYNNLFYSHPDQALFIAADNTGSTIDVSNNSFYVSNSDTIIDNDLGSAVNLRNNIFYQAGSGSCVQGSPVQTYNEYYFPNGNRGVALNSGERDGDPKWLRLPSDTFDINDFRLTQPVIGVDLSTLFSQDFNDNVRVLWNMGAYEFVSPSPPTNLIIK